MLARKEARMCSHIVDELPLAQSTASEHLRILRGAGLVQANENGPRVDYCIVPSALKRLRHCSRPCRKGFSYDSYRCLRSAHVLLDRGDGLARTS
jgi:DNA-binding transcriptional ArsR family regulator